MIDSHAKNSCSSSRNAGPDDSSSGQQEARQHSEGEDMSALVFANRNPRPGGGSHMAGKDLLFTAQSMGAVAGLAGGVLAGILGGLLTAVGWFVTEAGAR